MLLTLYGQAISFSCRRNNPNNRGPTHLYTNDFYTPTNVFKPSQKPLRQWVLTWVLIRSLILKVTSEGKSGCGLTLCSSGTSRSKITLGKKQHFPPSVYSCRAPVPDGRKAYTLFPCVRGLSSLPFGKGPGFSRWCVQSSHLAVCIPSAPSTPVPCGDSLMKWLWALPHSDQSPMFTQGSLLQSRARWSEEGRHKHFSLSLFFGCISPIYVYVQSVLTSF